MSAVYSKPYLNSNDIIAHLEQRGMHFRSSKDDARLFIEKISYYRLKAYLVPFRQRDPVNGEKALKEFRKDSFFEDVKKLYMFDEALRNIVFSWTQFIEIGIRTYFNELLTMQSGNPFWYLNSEYFSTEEYFSTITKMKGIFSKSKDESCLHYSENYYNQFCAFHKKLPPSWMIIEYISFGNLVTLMNSLSIDVIQNFHLNRSINKKFKIAKYQTIVNWIDIIHVVRNFCCHHSRLFNRNIKACESITNVFFDKKHLSGLGSPNRLYTALSAMQKILMGLGYDDINIGIKIDSLFKEFTIPEYIKRQMGFPENWEKDFLYVNKRPTEGASTHKVSYAHQLVGA